MRIDFWDNGFQQTIEAPYTVAPGETMQTHCFFDVSQQSSTIDFGSATAEEMCMEFVFYYPAQTRGVNADGDPEAFAMCGMFPQGSTAETVCGSLSQTSYGFFVLGEQVDKSSSPAIPDPLAFGVANLPALASVDGAVCVAPSPPYPLSPPRPLGPPGSEVETVYRTRVEMIVAGAVSDVTVRKRMSIAEAFATTAGVDASQVEVTVQAASVLIAVVVTSTTQAADNTVSSSLATALATSTAATTLIAATGLTVTSTPTLTSFTDTQVVPPSAPAVSSKRAGHLAHGILMSLAFAFLMPTGVVFPLFLRRRLSRWLLYHKTTQLTALAVCTAGLIVIELTISPSSRWMKTHNSLGLAVVILAYVQVLVAFVRPHAPKAAEGEKESPPRKSGWRKVWELSHRVLAILMPSIAIVQLFTGINHPSAAISQLGSIYAVFFVLLGLAAAIWIAAFFGRGAANKVAGDGYDA